MGEGFSEIRDAGHWRVGRDGGRLEAAKNAVAGSGFFANVRVLFAPGRVGEEER
jgi:hypothetical protein